MPRFKVATAVLVWLVLGTSPPVAAKPFLKGKLGALRQKMLQKKTHFQQFRQAKREVKRLTRSSAELKQVYTQAKRLQKGAGFWAHLNIASGVHHAVWYLSTGTLPWVSIPSAALGLSVGGSLVAEARHQGHRAGRMAVLKRAVKDPSLSRGVSQETRQYLVRNLAKDQQKAVAAYSRTKKRAARQRNEVRDNRKLLSLAKRFLDRP